MKFSILLALIGVSFASKLDVEWQQWKAKYGKTYQVDAEESVRKLIWLDNWKFVQKHNSENHTFTVETNEFADLTNEEFQKYYLTEIYIDSLPEVAELHIASDDEPMVATVDWRTQGLVTPVKNQGQCGSCWAFSATGSLEGQQARSSGQLVSLSEQQLIDCSGAYGNKGCDGGLMSLAFRYIQERGGINTEECYPYQAHDELCRYQSSCVGATLTGYRTIQSGSETSLQSAVQSVGPISVAIEAYYPSFQLYSSGIYDEPQCSSNRLDHGVLAVGYGSDSGRNYWIVKNSWGANWGMEGYILMSKDKNNQCGIATQASYPTV